MLELFDRSLRGAPSRLLLAVSGGPDSLALLAFLGEHHRCLRLDCTVATVDHGLRPESAGEARAVAGVAARYGLDHRTLAWTRDEGLNNLSAAARQGRYRLLCEAARAVGAGAVLTAHHEDDQIETHLMARERGEGLLRLAAMRPRRDLAPGLVLLRPFLSVPKARLLASLQERGLAFASDPSNDDPRFARARWRARLAGLDPNSRQAVLEAIAAASAARDRLDREIGRRVVTVETDAAGTLRAPRSIFRPAGPAAAALLSRMLSAAGGSASRASAVSIERLAARLAGEEPGFAATLGGCRLTVAPDRVVVSREYGRAGPPSLDLRSGACFDERFDLDPAEARSGRLVPLGALGRASVFDATLPVALDDEGRPVAAHPMALRRLPKGLRPLCLTERVSWRLAHDLPGEDLVRQIAAKEPAQVGKIFPADYLPSRRMERRKVDARARPVETQSQDER